MIVVMVTSLITAIGMLAVRNISQVDAAAGYGRQSAQTMALAEMGATAAAAQLANNKTFYVRNSLNPLLGCDANRGLPNRACYPLAQAEIEQTTASASGGRMLEPTVAGTDTGSFGPVSSVTGFIDIEVTDIHRANIHEAGSDLEVSPLDATLTATARVMPTMAAAAPCNANVSIMTVKKVMRAHVIF